MTNVEIVREMLRAIEDRNGEALAAVYHPDVEFIWPPELPGYGGTHRGWDEVVAMGYAFTELWDPRQPTSEWRDLRFRIIAAQGDSVVVHYHQRGVDASGRTCDCEVLAHYELEAGKVRRLQMHYLDPSAVRDFLTAS